MGPHLAPIPETDAVTARPPRIAALDVLRGFALCGILLVNIGPVTKFQYDIPHPGTSLEDPSGWLQLLVQQRFFPIFSLLFGIGFSLLMAGAQRRTTRPRLMLARRLVLLLPLGLVHQLWHPGEALTAYAVVGLLVLLPSSWLPRSAVAVGAAVLIAASFVLTGGGITLIPGVFLLGSTLVRYGVVHRIEQPTRAPVAAFAVFVVFAAASVPAASWQLQDLPQSGFSTSSALAGLLMAGAYAGGLLVLLATPLRPILQALFIPLGRMALTNYVTATPLMVIAGQVLDLPHSRSWTHVFLVAAAILVTQLIVSTLWLRRFRQGPLEWLWRSATWGRRQPLRRDPTTPPVPRSQTRRATTPVAPSA